MPTGAAIGIGTLGSAAVGASAAKSAAKTQSKAARDAADLQLQMFGQTREDLAPYRDFGSGALPALDRLLGLSSAPPIADFEGYINSTGNRDVLDNYNRLLADPTQKAGLESLGVKDAAGYGKLHYDTFGKTEGRELRQIDPISAELEKMPGYKFLRDQGIKSIGHSLGSRGQTGAQAKGIARFVTGLADTTYSDQVNRLMAAAGIGSGAAAQTGNFGTQTGSNVGQALIGAGTASASGQVGAANAISGGIGNATNMYIANRLLSGGGGGGGGFGSAVSGIWGA